MDFAAYFERDFLAREREEGDDEEGDMNALIIHGCLDS